MNTSVEFFEWLLHTGNEDNTGLLHNEDSPCRLGPPPSMVSFSDSELSSLESDDVETGSMCSNDCASTADKLSAHPSKSLLDSTEHRPPPRRVSFQHVEVREYSITVGDHPFCYDGLPLTLDWEHADSVEIRDIESSRERRGNYRAPRRLSFDERRDRLFNMAGTASAAASSGGDDGASNNDDNDRAFELGLIIKMLHNSWSMNSILPPPVLYDIEEDEDDNTDEASVGSARSRSRTGKKKGHKSKNAQKEQVVEWKRVPFRRSNAFSE
jgi:hypothetical protein